MVVEQQWNFFPKAYAPGPSQLWLCSGTLQLRARPPRPLDQDFNTQWHCTQSVSPSVQPFFSGVLFSILPLQSRAACGSSCQSLPIVCVQRLAVHLVTRCRDLARAGFGGATRIWLPPPSCRVERRRDPAVFGRLSSTSNRAQRGQERYKRASLLATFPFQTSGPRRIDACSGLSFSLSLFSLSLQNLLTSSLLKVHFLGK